MSEYTIENQIAKIYGVLLHFRPIFGCTPTIKKIKGTIFSQQIGKISYIFAGLSIVSDQLEILDKCDFRCWGWVVLEHEFAFAGDNTLDFLFTFLIADVDSFLLKMRMVFHAIFLIFYQL